MGPQGHEIEPRIALLEMVNIPRPDAGPTYLAVWGARAGPVRSPRGQSGHSQLAEREGDFHYIRCDLEINYVVHLEN